MYFRTNHNSFTHLMRWSFFHRNHMQTYRQILRSSLKTLPKASIIALILMVMTHALFLLMPQYLGDMTDAILGNNPSLLKALATTLIIITIGAIIIERIENIVGDYIIAKLEVLRTIYYRSKLQSLSYSQITSEWSGKIISKIDKWITAEVQIYRSILRMCVVVGIRWSVIFYLITSQYPAVTLPAAWIILVLWGFQYRASRKINPLTDQQSDTRESSSRNLVRQIQEWMLVHIHNKQDYEVQNDYKTYAGFVTKEIKIAAYSYSIYDVLHLCFRLGETAGIFYLGHMVMQWSIWYGEITRTITYLWFFWRPLEVAINQFMVINKHSSYYTKLYKFAHQTPDITDGDQQYTYQWGHIRFDNVQFWYQSDSDILDNFSLTFDPGTTTALVGHSWSGKSTIVKLLLRLYDIQSWQITVDSQDISSLQISTLYDHVGYLTQEPSIFDGTVRENLEYGLSNSIASWSDESALRQALEYAQLDGLVQWLSQWLNTQIGEKWVKLSGWERQRLAIARIFLRNPDILILDEPTAALDSISEHKITQLITDMMQGKTVIVIAHRLQTVMSADRIIVMDHGQIIQSWTHDQLLSQDGMYRSLVNLQSGMIEE